MGDNSREAIKRPWVVELPNSSAPREESGPTEKTYDSKRFLTGCRSGLEDRGLGRTTPPMSGNEYAS